MASLYANENFPRRVVDALRELGHDVLTALEAANANQAISDLDVLAFAVANQRAVLTLNGWDFVRLHAAHPVHAGIIVCSQDPNLVRQAERIHQMIGGRSTLDNLLLRVNRPQE